MHCKKIKNKTVFIYIIHMLQLSKQLILGDILSKHYSPRRNNNTIRNNIYYYY